MSSAMNLGGRLEQVPWWLLPFPELHSIPGHTVCSVTSIEVRVPSLTGLQCVSLTVSASGRMLTETAKKSLFLGIVPSTFPSAAVSPQPHPSSDLTNSWRLAGLRGPKPCTFPLTNESVHVSAHSTVISLS